MAELVDNTPSTNRQLEEKWTLWVHLPSDPDWTLKGYYKIHTFSTIDDIISIIESTPHSLVKGAMMFIMRAGVTPIWEDKNNKNGGCFSFKIANKDVEKIWKEVYYRLIGQSLTREQCDYEKINGITLSPKKKFCILKIWMKDCTLDDPNIFVKINNLKCDGCLFKKHCLEY